MQSVYYRSQKDLLQIVIMITIIKIIIILKFVTIIILRCILFLTFLLQILTLILAVCIINFCFLCFQVADAHFGVGWVHFIFLRPALAIESFVPTAWTARKEISSILKKRRNVQFQHRFSNWSLMQWYCSKSRWICQTFDC